MQVRKLQVKKLQVRKRQVRKMQIPIYILIPVLDNSLPAISGTDYFHYWLIQRPHNSYVDILSGE